MLPRYYLFLLLIFFITIVPASAQILRGRVEDTKGVSVAYATVYIQELKQGIVANEEGEFNLALPAGVYTCSFGRLGYDMVTQTVEITTQSNLLKIVLTEKTYELSAVQVSSSDEDPAYGIMRKAISRAPYYNQVVKEYIADVYVKGSFKVGDIKGLAGLALDKQTKKALSNSSGVVESVNEIHFKAPNTMETRVKAVQQALSFDLKQLGDDDIGNIDVGMMVVNIYNPRMKILSTRSFADYKFKYEGDFEENGRFIYKLKVIPKYKRDELYSGYIYIVDSEWCVHSFNLASKLMGFDFRLEQRYGEVVDGIYLPISSRAEVGGKAVGIQISGAYNNSIKYSLVVPNVKTTAAANANTVTVTPVTKANPTKEKKEQQLSQLMDKEKPSTRDMRRAVQLQEQLADMEKEEERMARGEKKSLEVKRRDNAVTHDSSARRHDAAYWDSIRPIPLVAAEVVTFHKQDSITRINEGLSADTTLSGKRKQTANLVTGLIFGGHTFRIDTSLSITYNGLLDINQFTFNTVDGFVVGQSGKLEKRFAESRRLSLEASIAYAFSRSAVLGKLKLQHRYWPQCRAEWGVEGGHATADFAGVRGIGAINDYSSLIWRVNYSTFYDSRYLKLHNTIDIANGLALYAEVGYENSRQESNHTDFSFFYKDTRDYRPNIPRNEQVEANPALLADNVAFTTDVRLEYTPYYYYRMHGERKQMLYSHFPTFTWRWQRGWTGVLGSNTDFDLLSMNIRQSIRIHTDEVLRYDVTGGVFLNNNTMAFQYFRHFGSNEAGVSLSAIGNTARAYQLLPQYTYSTNDWYATANVSYTARYLALKYIPFLANVLMNENLSVAYLLTPQMRHYTEWGYALTDIYFVGDIGIFVGFEGSHYYGWGVRASFNLDRLTQ